MSAKSAATYSVTVVQIVKQLKLAIQHGNRTVELADAQIFKLDVVAPIVLIHSFVHHLDGGCQAEDRPDHK